MRCENMILIKRIGKDGTNIVGLKKKPKFKELILLLHPQCSAKQSYYI
jgi:hypothetical protein